MMESLFAVLLVVGLTAGASALNCYTCTEGASGTFTNTPACNDPFNVNTTDGYVLRLSCANVSQFAPTTLGLTKFDVCAKTMGTINGVYTVARTCYDSDQCPSRNGCVSRNGATVCCCNTNYCNGGTVVSISALFAVAMIVAAFFFAM